MKPGGQTLAPQTAAAGAVSRRRGLSRALRRRLDWNARSLAAQFFLAGGCVSVLAMLLMGVLVTHLIEDAVIRNSGAATALYVDSVVAPLLPDMQKGNFLDDSSARALDETLSQGALGQRLVSFKLWRRDGTILYSNDKTLVGRTFPPNGKLQEAFAGSLVARYEVADDPESTREGLSGKPMMEIYNPVLQPWSGQAVAVLEFYENASGLDDSLRWARLSSWAVVGLFTGTFFAVLSAIVLRGSRIIGTQGRDLSDRVTELSALLSENRMLQNRLQAASQRAAALNEGYLRRIGTDLHDGPLQHMGYASMRLDSKLFRSTEPDRERLQDEIGWIRSSLAEAMAEIRNLCKGLVLPQIEAAGLGEIVRRAVEAHEQNTRSRVVVEVSETGPQPPPAVRICIYRFIQEALNNAYRHGGGISQMVEASLRGGHVTVAVADGGGGFDPAAVAPSRLGLLGLRERVTSLGGRFELQTGPEGTTVTMRFAPMEGGEECLSSPLAS